MWQASTGLRSIGRGLDRASKGAALGPSSESWGRVSHQTLRDWRVEVAQGESRQGRVVLLVQPCCQPYCTLND